MVKGLAARGPFARAAVAMAGSFADNAKKRQVEAAARIAEATAASQRREQQQERARTEKRDMSEDGGWSMGA